MTKNDYRQLTALYDGSIAYLDASLHELVEYLKQKHLLDNTLLIITSDHGENLGEQGGLLNHSFSVHQTLLHVPLLIKYPQGWGKGLRHKGLVSTMGIFSKILDQTNSMPDSAWPPHHESLFRMRDNANAQPIISEYELPLVELHALADIHGVDVKKFAVRQKAIQNMHWKIIWRSEGLPELYDLAADPNETTSIYPYAVSDGRMLLKDLDTWNNNLKLKTLTADVSLTPIDKQIRRSLRSLGYAH